MTMTVTAMVAGNGVPSPNTIIAKRKHHLRGQGRHHCRPNKDDGTILAKKLTKLFADNSGEVIVVVA